MTTTYYEKITEGIANDETKLKEFVLAKISDSCPVNDNWLNASIRYGAPDTLKLTAKYISISVLDKEWKYYPLATRNPVRFPRVILFKPPTWKKAFGSVRATDERGAEMWHLYESKKFSPEDIYVVLLPALCKIDFLHADVKSLRPPVTPGHEGKPTTGSSKANERSGKSEGDVPIQPAVFKRDSELAQRPVENYPFQTYPFVRTEIIDNGYTESTDTPPPDQKGSYDGTAKN